MCFSIVSLKQSEVKLATTLPMILLPVWLWLLRRPKEKSARAMEAEGKQHHYSLSVVVVKCGDRCRGASEVQVVLCLLHSVARSS